MEKFLVQENDDELDDIDFVGTQAFCHGSSMVFISLTEKTFEIYPAFEKNVKNYRRYSEAMEDEALVALRPKLSASPFEKRLVEKNGEKYFVEKHYKKSKIYNASENDRVLYENPFEAQKPFIRLEAQLSTVGDDEALLVAFDENAPVENGKYDFDKASNFIFLNSLWICIVNSKIYCFFI